MNLGEVCDLGKNKLFTKTVSWQTLLRTQMSHFLWLPGNFSVKGGLSALQGFGIKPKAQDKKCTDLHHPTLRKKGKTVGSQNVFNIHPRHARFSAV